MFESMYLSISIYLSIYLSIYIYIHIYAYIRFSVRRRTVGGEDVNKEMHSETEAVAFEATTMTFLQWKTTGERC